MPPPPPPPPPGAPPPPTVKASGPPKVKKSGGGTDRGALLSDIHKGMKLKKTVTNDRSAPSVGDYGVSRPEDRTQKLPQLKAKSETVPRDMLGKMKSGNKPSPGGGGRGAGPLMPPGGGANKFNTVACHNNRPNSRELPNSWRGAQDDGVAKNNMINQKRKQSLTGPQTIKQPLKPSFSDGAGTPTPPSVGGLGGLFAGGVPRLPSANKRQQGGQRGPGGPTQAFRPPGPRMPNGPSSVSNGPGRNTGGPPPPPSNTKPGLNQRPMLNGQNRPGPPPPPPAQNKPTLAGSPGKLSNDDRNGHMRGSNTSLNSNSSRLSISGESNNSINNNARPRSGVMGGVPRSQPPPPPNRPPPTTAPGKPSSQWPPPPPPQSAKGPGPPPPPPQSAKSSGPPPPPPQSAKGGAPPPPPPQSAKGPGNRPPSMVGRPLPPPPSQGAPPPPPPSNRPPPPPSSSLKPTNRPSSVRTNQPPPPPSQPPRQGGPPPPPPTRTTSAQNGGTLPRTPGVRPPPPPMRGPQSTGAMPPPPPQRRSGNYSGGSDDFENRFRFHNANECPPPEPFSKMNKTYPSKNPRNPGKNTGARAPPPPPPK